MDLKSNNKLIKRISLYEMDKDCKKLYTQLIIKVDIYSNYTFNYTFPNNNDLEFMNLMLEFLKMNDIINSYDENDIENFIKINYIYKSFSPVQGTSIYMVAIKININENVEKEYMILFKYNKIEIYNNEDDCYRINFDTLC